MGGCRHGTGLQNLPYHLAMQPLPLRCPLPLTGRMVKQRHPDSTNPQLSRAVAPDSAPAGPSCASKEHGEGGSNSVSAGHCPQSASKEAAATGAAAGPRVLRLRRTPGEVQAQEGSSASPQLAQEGKSTESKDPQGPVINAAKPAPTRQRVSKLRRFLGLQVRGAGTPCGAAPWKCFWPCSDYGPPSRQHPCICVTGGPWCAPLVMTCVLAACPPQATFMFSGVWHILVFWYNTRVVSWRWALFFIIQVKHGWVQKEGMCTWCFGALNALAHSVLLGFGCPAC